MSRRLLTIPMLVDQLATANGGWKFVGNHRSITITVEGLEGGATVDIRCSNRPYNSTPAVNDLGALEQTINANSAKALSGGYNWIRAVKTQGGAPTATSVYAVADPVLAGAN